MAITNQERVANALDLLKDGLGPYVEREIRSVFKGDADRRIPYLLGDEHRAFAGRPATDWDVSALTRVIWDAWNDVFGRVLGQAERNLVAEVRTVRNDWAHQKAFSSDDTDRALDSIQRLLTAISAPQANEVSKAKMELRRLVFEEQSRADRRGTTSTPIAGQDTAGLKPWREVITPHADVADGSYQTAEFAADLWQVYRGEGVDEYANPVEFFRRTYLTASLRELLSGALKRITGQGGDPVVQLQTNFGGGKTHSMLALYHLFAGGPPTVLPGLEDVLLAAGVTTLPKVNRVVIVGNMISPGSPNVKEDGTTVRTLWGELAWQLGYSAGGTAEARKAFLRVAEDDEKSTNPGNELRALLSDYGPCLILIDEWVAYARQLHDDFDLPGGSFETHFTFAQALTEAASGAKQCLLVISLPASDASGSPHIQAEDVEVGGERGRAALDRLRNAVGRIETSWRPASAEEGFEIVRRRLFETLTDRQLIAARDATARAFHDLYAAQGAEFPAEAKDAAYEKRLRDAYPIHPEVFDRLYTDWSTLVKFQRTRGVLRLMAAVIHSLWQSNDRSPLIMPANLPIDDQRVQAELTRYLPDQWVPIIESDVDGANSLPRRIDGQNTNLGKYSACQRVARTVYLGSAPSGGVANLGIEDRQIKLGCVLPGESSAHFGDALRHLATEATYLYQDGNRYWYATQPNLNKVAEERAEDLKRKPDEVAKEVETRLRVDLKDSGDFSRVHPFPQSGQDVPDDTDARLVVMGIDHPYSREGSKAEAFARSIFESRGNSPRLFRNTLAFLVADQARVQDLDNWVRHFLAWKSIVNESERLNLPPDRVKQAEAARDSANASVEAQIPEAYRWVLVPAQDSPQSPTEWKGFQLTGQGSLAARAAQRLKREELLVTSMAGTILRHHLDKVPLWRGDNVAVAQLIEDFARYLYLPRLRSAAVLIGAIKTGMQLLTWRQDSFAYADSFDEAEHRYRGLVTGQLVNLPDDGHVGLLVKSEIAERQLEAETTPPPPAAVGPTGEEPPLVGGGIGTVPVSPPGEQPVPAPTAPRRYHATVALNPQRAGADAGKVAEEVIGLLVAQMGAEVKVTLEIEANLPGGASETLVRNVTENGRTLKFTSQGFEAD